MGCGASGNPAIAEEWKNGNLDVWVEIFGCF